MEGHRTHNRPLLLSLGSADTKKKIFKNLKKLRESEEPFRSIQVSHDLTVKERDELKSLVKTAKEKEEQAQGNWLYRVRGPPWDRRITKLPPLPKETENE